MGEKAHSDHHDAGHVHHPRVETPPLHDPADAWHDHAQDEKPQHEHGEIRNPATVMGVGIGLFLAVAVATLVVDAFYKWYASQALAAASVTTSANSTPMQARALKSDILKSHRSSEPSWIVIPPLEEGAKPTAVARIPLSVAAERVASEYAARMGGKVSAAVGDHELSNPSHARKE